MKVNFEQFEPLIDRFVADAGWFGPELVLILVIVLLLLVDLLLPRQKSINLVMLALMGVILAFGTVIWDMLRLAGPISNVGGGSHQFPYIFQGMLKVDKMGYFFKSLILMGTAGTIIMTFKDRRFHGKEMGEYYALLLAAVLGMFLMVSSSHLLMIYLAVEMTSIPSYLLVAFHRDDEKATEASLKYLLYGAVASGIMLFGLSYLFGVTGKAHLNEVTMEAFMLIKSTNGEVVGSIAGLVFFMVFAGIAYKISTAPMQFWTPDVYEGASTPITNFLAITSKAAGFGLLLRVLHSMKDSGLANYMVGEGTHNFLTGDLMATGFSGYVLTLAVLSAITMTLGNFMALHQSNVKRMLAYSSIAHAGYLLMGVCVLNERGQSATLFYLAGYLIMNLGAFYIVMLNSNATQSEEISSFSGLGKASPYYAGAMALMMFSLVGIPPTVGFAGKFQLFAAAITYEGIALWWLVLIGGLNTAVSLYYYARVIKAMFLEDGDNHPGIAGSTLNDFIVFSLTFVTLFLGVHFNWLIESATSAAL